MEFLLSACSFLWDVRALGNLALCFQCPSHQMHGLLCYVLGLKRKLPKGKKTWRYFQGKKWDKLLLCLWKWLHLGLSSFCQMFYYCTLQKLLLIFWSFLCTLHCCPLILKWIFTFWASWAEDYSIKGWQVGALPGWHHSCPRLAYHLATPKNIYCTSCYLCFMFHMLTFSPVSKFFC